MNEAERLDVVKMADYEQLFPDRVSEIREWSRMYKTLDGKAENEFTEDGRCYSQ